MKKILIFLLAAVLLTGCQNASKGQSETVTETTSKTSAETSAETKTVKEITTVTESTAAVTTIAETKPLTPLEKEYAWLDYIKDKDYVKHAFLYDFTGDGFPECMDLFFEPYILSGRITSEAYGWQHGIVAGGDLYVCRDSGGKNFIVTSYSLGADAIWGMTPYTALRYDFYADGIIETVIGEANVYYNNDEYYAGICTFLGEDLECGRDENAGGILEKRLMEYISEYELVDTIKIENENGEIKAVFEADTNFTVENAAVLPEYDGTEIYLQSIEIHEKNIKEGIDLDYLDRYEYIGQIEFSKAYEPPAEKYKIPEGDWHKNVKTLRIDINTWDTSELSSFTDAEYVIVDGINIERSDLEFLKDMPSVKCVYLYFAANSADAFIPLTEMPSLEALIDSGHGSCMEYLSEEDKTKVKELFPEDKYFWGMVK